MSYFLSPIGNDQQCDANGNPLVGGGIYTYLAGTSTPAATYTDNTGGTPQANPIVLNSLGLPTSPVWLLGGVTYKFIIKDSGGSTIHTIDNVSGINDSTTTISDWLTLGVTPTYLSATSFSVTGDQTSILGVGRRVKTANTGGTAYSTITASSYGAGITTVTVANDSLTLDSGITSVNYGIVSSINPSLPNSAITRQTMGIAAYGLSDLTVSAGGSADALTATFTPAFATLAAASGVPLLIRAASANATTTPTLAINGLTAKTIVKGNGLALVAGDIAGAGHWLDIQYDVTLDKFVLANPAKGINITIPTYYVGNGTKATLSADVTGIASATASTISWTAESFDDLNWHSTASNQSRITVDATARYRITFCLSYEWDTGGTYTSLARPKANLLKNAGAQRDWRGTVYYANSSAIMDSGNVTRISFQGSDEYELTANDYLELQQLIYFSSGTMKVLAADSYFLVERVKG